MSVATVPYIPVVKSQAALDPAADVENLYQQRRSECPGEHEVDAMNAVLNTIDKERVTYPRKSKHRRHLHLTAMRHVAMQRGSELNSKYHQDRQRYQEQRQGRIDDAIHALAEASNNSPYRSSDEHRDNEIIRGIIKLLQSPYDYDLGELIELAVEHSNFSPSDILDIAVQSADAQAKVYLDTQQYARMNEVCEIGAAIAAMSKHLTDENPYRRDF